MPPTAKLNRLLGALPEKDYERLVRQCEPVDLPLGWVIYESGSRLQYVYFPVSGIVSLLNVMRDGASAEIAVVGNEGLVGIVSLLHGDTTLTWTVVQCAGRAYRLRADILRREFEHCGPFQHLLLRYTQSLMTQMAQAAACNRHHTVEKQLCRWLLLSLDRLSSNKLRITQEVIANMLGVRREAVGEAAGRLQAKGVIHYSRGHITVLSRAKLETLVCECYAAVKGETDRLLPERNRSLKPALSFLAQSARAEVPVAFSRPPSLSTARRMRT